jgi:hypothetical protein
MANPVEDFAHIFLWPLSLRPIVTFTQPNKFTIEWETRDVCLLVLRNAEQKPLAQALQAENNQSSVRYQMHVSAN